MGIGGCSLATATCRGDIVDIVECFRVTFMSSEQKKKKKKVNS